MGEKLSSKLETRDIDRSGLDWSVLSDLAKNPDKKGQAFGFYTSENTNQYVKDRFSDNIAMLENDVGNEHFVELYKNIMSEFPTLRMVTMSDENIDDNAYFSLAHSSNGLYMPEVACNLSHPETYAFEASDRLEDLQTTNDRLGTVYFIKRLAFAIGADWKSCAKNVKLNADATLLHEFGHAHDFIENYLRPEYEKINGDSRGAEALYYAAKINRANRSEFKKRGPNPDGNWIGRKSNRWREHEYRLKAMGIDNYDEYLYAVHQYYRDMPDESYADKFAYDYIMCHYDEYFTTDKTELSERILVDEAKEIELDPDFVHILGLKQGLGVEVDRLDGNRKSVKHISGFLATNMYVGKSMYLYENGDPKNPGEKWRICRGISDIRLKPMKNRQTGKLEHYVFFRDDNGTEYHISRTKREADTVDGTPDEMAIDLGLRVGDKVQLIEHLGDDARNLNQNNFNNTHSSLIEGHIIRIDGKDVRENVVIEYQDSVNRSVGINYPAKRKWKTWYVGDYEILPMPK